jgi:ribosome-binding factor A
METKRQNKIARLIQKEISEILQSITREMNKGILITPTIVRVSPDLSVAKVYLSIFPTDKSAEMLAFVAERSQTIKHHLAGRTRFQLRTVPNLSFYLDDSLDYIENIDKLLK